MHIKIESNGDISTISVDVGGEWVKTPYTFKVGVTKVYELSDGDFKRFLDTHEELDTQGDVDPAGNIEEYDVGSPDV